MCRLFLGRQAQREHLAYQQSTNNEYNHYTESNLLINNVPLSAHTNNYLIKLIIPLNKTGPLLGPANFPIIPIKCLISSSGVKVREKGQNFGIDTVDTSSNPHYLPSFFMILTLPGLLLLIEISDYVNFAP